jgi:acyl dehydratase
MALDPSLVGRTYPPTAPYSVGREKIREFATAIGDTNPACHDVGAAHALGYGDLVAPPTFAVMLTMTAGRQAIQDPDVGIDYSRVVHGEQRFVHHRPIVAGDELRVIATIDSIRAAAGNDMLGMRADVVDRDNQPVLSAYSMLVARGTA